MTQDVLSDSLLVLLQERTGGGLQRALATKQHRDRMSQDARHSERQHKVSAVAQAGASCLDNAA